MPSIGDNKNTNQLDDLVQYVTLHVPIPIIFGGGFFPFLVLVGIWFYVVVFIYEFNLEDHFEAVFLSILAISSCFLLLNLCCFWNVHMKALLYLRKVKVFYIKKSKLKYFNLRGWKVFEVRFHKL